MTELLNKAVKEASKLSESLQDELALQLLDDIRNEIKWQSTLSKGQDKLNKFAQRAKTDSINGKTKKIHLDEL